MPSTISSVAPPTLSSPSQLASQSRQPAASETSSSRPLLPGTPESSLSTGQGFSVGSVYKVGSNGVRRARGSAVYAAVGQGVVVVNPSTLAAITSYTFSPSLQPISAPLVVQSGSQQTTFLCLSPKNDNSSAEVHIWTQARSSSNEQSAIAHHTCKIDSSVRSLHPLMSGQVLAHHCDGRFSIVEALEEGVYRSFLQSLSPSPPGLRWTHHFSVLDRFASAALTRSSSKKASVALIVRFSSASNDLSAARSTRKGRKSAMDVIDAVEGQSSSSSMQTGGSGKLQMEVFSVNDGGEGGERLRVESWSLLDLLPALQLKDAREVKDVSLFHSGRLALCTTSGKILSTTVRLDHTGTPTLDPTVSVSLPSLTQASTSAHPRLASLQLVTSTTALVVVAAPSSDSISALLVDLDLACVMSETSWNAKGVESTFVHRVAGSIVLVLASRRDGSSKVGATVWSLPYEVSEGTHLRWALTNSSLTKKWMGAAEKSKSSADDGEVERVKLIKELQRIGSSRHGADAAQAQEQAFDKWRGKEINRVKSQWLMTKQEDEQVVESSDSEGEKQPSKAKGKSKAVSRAEAPTAVYPQSFVSQILSLALPTSGDDGGYAKQIVHQLLSDRAMSNNLRTGLLTSLVAVNDWEAVMVAMSTVHDLPEEDIVEVLLLVVRTKSAERPVLLESFLQSFVSSALNRALVRVALKSRMDKVEEVVAVLDVLLAWLDRAQDESLTKVEAPKVAGKKGDKSKLAEMDAILTLLCDMMDTFFPLFLSTPATHQRLKRLHRQVNDHMAVYNQLLILRGPLEAFSRLQADKEREAALESQKRTNANDHEEAIMGLQRADKKAAGGDRRNNAIGEVGGGLGKGVLGEKSRRRQLYEENVAVGLYSLERLEW